MGPRQADRAEQQGQANHQIEYICPGVASTLRCTCCYSGNGLGFGEVADYRHSLEYRPREAPTFYLVYSAGVLGGAILVAIVPNLATLSIVIRVLNALTPSVVLGLLVALAMKALPHKHRWYRVAIPGIAVSITVLGVFIELQAGCYVVQWTPLGIAQLTGSPWSGAAATSQVASTLYVWVSTLTGC